MVGLGLGIGLGIGANQRRRRSGASSPAEDTIKAALKERHHISATRDGVSVLIQPYALFKVGSAGFLYGVIVFIDGEARGDWTPDRINVTALTNVEVYDKAFVPSDAFDPSSLDGVVAVVEGFDPFQDVRQVSPDES